MTRPPRPMPTPQPRRAFTLIEVMVAVALLVLLTSLLVVGIRHLTTNAKRQQTHAILAQCQSMYNNWQAVAHQPFYPSTMPPPGDVTAPPGRFSNDVWLTRDVIVLMRSVPSNAAALDKLAPSGRMLISNDAAYFPATNGKFDTTMEYKPFDAGNGKVYVYDADGNRNYYRCIQDTLVTKTDPITGATSTTLVAPPNKNYWIQAYPFGPADSSHESVVQVPLDAWGNPVLFVPGGKFGPTGAPLSSPDGKPFFISAGPDGNFAGTDDNIASFEP